ncbi:MAG: DUF2029 domain-containing protein [Kiritimatiellae bacterium]|nr:DUF2029 domain-containing protein [Kiritimatiellia bacterium]
MKARAIGIASAVLLAAAAFFTVATLFTPSATRCDFSYRMAEADCLRRGVDPFLVWNESVVLKPYYSNNPARKSVPEGCNRQISVYTPWGYSLALPMSFLSLDAAWWFFSVMSFAMLGLVVAAGVRSLGWLAAVPMLVVAYPIWSNFQVGNYIALMLAAAVCMAACLYRGWNVAAGVCWMLLMIKPQVGLTFAVPLAVRMRIKSGAVAVVACLALSVPAVLLCRPELPKFFYEAAEASAFAFQGCGTWPMFLCGTFGCRADIGIGLVIGLLLCVWMTWLLRREKDWLVYLMPAAICSSCWTYTQAYSHAMGWFVAYVIVRKLIENPRSKFLWALFLISLPVLSRAFLAWHGFAAFFGADFPMSEYTFRCLDSLNSTASLAIAAVLCVCLSGHPVAFCIWRRRRQDCDIIRPAEA